MIERPRHRHPLSDRRLSGLPSSAATAFRRSAEQRPIERRDLREDAVANRLQEAAVLLEHPAIVGREREPDVAARHRRHELHPPDEDARDVRRRGSDRQRHDARRRPPAARCRGAARLPRTTSRSTCRPSPRLPSGRGRARRGCGRDPAAASRSRRPAPADPASRGRSRGSARRTPSRRAGSRTGSRRRSACRRESRRRSCRRAARSRRSAAQTCRRRDRRGTSPSAIPTRSGVASVWRAL